MPRQRWLLLASSLFAAGPLIAGANGLLSRRHDPRLLSMAVASGIVTVLVVRIQSGAARFTTIMLFDMAIAAAVAYAEGARAPFGIWAVALVLALFWSTSAVLYLLALPEVTQVRTS